VGEPELRAGERSFEALLAPRMRSMSCFREPTDEEVERSYAAWCSGDVELLLRTWQEVAEPTRARVPWPSSWFYRHLGLGPRSINAVSFLITVRAALRAGERFRERVSAPTRRAIALDFPWMEHRHEHIPDGFTPVIEFPDVFTAFIDAPDLEDARARWQLCAVINEIQQCHYSRFAAGLFRLPELLRHAERERELAICYAAHWSPGCTIELWRQCLWVLDALNAEVFDWVNRNTARMVWEAARSSIAGRGEWEAFVAGLEVAQRLMEVAEQETNHRDTEGTEERRRRDR
jgi:hypothetical protein